MWAGATDRGRLPPGASLGVAAGASALALAIGGDSEATLTALLLALAAAGVTVCAVGLASAHNRANCWPSLGAAMLTVPVVLTMLLNNTNQDPDRHVGATALAATWLLLPPLLSTTAWHLLKRPRLAAPAAFGPSPRRLAMSQPRRRSSTPSGQLLLPLLATTF